MEKTNCGKTGRSEESIELPFPLPKRYHFTGEWNKVTNNLC